MNANEKDVVVLIGSGQIGQAIARRVGSGRHIVLADLKQEHADQAARVLENTGFTTSTLAVDISSRSSILGLIDHAQQFGAIKYLINAAGVSRLRLGRNDLERRPLRYGRLIGRIWQSH